MVFFRYPNVEAQEFIGTGLFTSILPGEVKGVSRYRKAAPNMPDSKTVVHAAYKLSPDSFDSPCKVYQNKDDFQYCGSSMGLSYLLAMISRSKSLKWKGITDIWATGVIEISDNLPLLRPVDAADIKIMAFANQKEASVFIVPYQNDCPDELDKRNEIRLLTLKQFYRFNKNQAFDQKVILRVHEYELSHLVNALFEMRFKDHINIRTSIYMPAIIIFVILFLVGIYQYWSQPINIHYPEKTFKKIQTMAPDINMPFVWIPEGCFKNPETTCLNGFWMSKHEVTQNQWNIIMKYNPAFHEDSENQLPVESVSWKQINQFIQALNQEQGHDFALPTGIQWDYAFSFSFQANAPCTAHADQPYTICFYGEDKIGLCDMNGNVMEWCDDDNDIATKPVRGCSWSTPISMTHSTVRYDQNQKSCDLGFRLIWRKSCDECN
jgi:hypothetical protein